MKKICLLLLLICHITWGQNKTFKGIIKDSETLQPIHFVNIYTENELNTNLTGSISNENGEFLISTSSSKIVFSHINYETLSIEFDGNFKEIVLKPKNYISDEIIISKEAGTAVAYNARIPHEIQEITNGSRWSIVMPISSLEIIETKTLL